MMKQYLVIGNPIEPLYHLNFIIIGLKKIILMQSMTKKKSIKMI